MTNNTYLYDWIQIIYILNINVEEKYIKNLKLVMFVVEVNLFANYALLDVIQTVFREFNSPLWTSIENIP